MPITAIEPRRLYRQVAEQLRGLIDGGEYRAGDRLPTERELSERLGISRPTVREALIALEVEGRVRIRVGSGIYVTEGRRPSAEASPSEIDGPFEILRARELIEGAVAAAAARAAGPADVARLDEVLSRMEGGSHPSVETIALDRLFHATVAGIVGNPVTVRIVGDLFDQRMSPYFERLSGYFENGESWRLAAREHRVVRDAIARGDAEAAAKAMRTHLENSQTRFQIGFGENEAKRGTRAVPAGAGRETAAGRKSTDIEGRNNDAKEILASRRPRRARARADERPRASD